MPPGACKGKGVKILGPGGPSGSSGFHPAWPLPWITGSSPVRPRRSCAAAGSGRVARAASRAAKSQPVAAAKKSFLLMRYPPASLNNSLTLCAVAEDVLLVAWFCAHVSLLLTTSACGGGASFPGKVCDFSGPRLDLAPIPAHFWPS